MLPSDFVLPHSRQRLNAYVRSTTFSQWWPSGQRQKHRQCEARMLGEDDPQKDDERKQADCGQENRHLAAAPRVGVVLRRVEWIDVPRARIPVASAGASDLARPLALSGCDSARRREAAARVETVRTRVVLVCPEMDPRAAAPLRFGEHGVQEEAADSLAPAVGNDEEVAQETASGYDRARPALAP